MEQIAEQITEGFIKELPEESQFFTSKELLSAGIPHVVVETLKKNIATTIESELQLPGSDWIQTDSENVELAWHDFVEISKQHAKIPASRLSSLLGESVEQCLELTLKPRQAVPDIIFKARTEIDLETAKKRVSSLEVNQPLGLALLRYMERKGKSEITLEKARDLVKKVDQKMVEDYHPLNWVQVLKPVFEMAGPAVEAKLFAIFFEDKGKFKVAQKFDLLNEKIEETDFIEIMSSADMLEVEGYVEDQEQLFEPVEEEEVSVKNEEVDGLKEEQVSETEDKEERKDITDVDDTDEEESNIDIIDEEQSGEPEPVRSEEDAGPGEEPDQREENIVELFSGKENRQEDDEDLYYLEKDEEESGLTLVEADDESGEENEYTPLLNKFMFDESVTESGDEDPEDEYDESDETGEQEPSSIYEEMNLVQNTENLKGETEDDLGDPSDADKTETDFDFDEETREAELSREEAIDEFSYKSGPQEDDQQESLQEQTARPEEETEESDQEDDDPPMWRSFLERDDIEMESGFEYEEDSEGKIEVDEEEEFIEEPIYDLTVSEPEPEEKISEVSKWLDDEKDRFVEEIFRDSEIAYEQALLEIVDFEDWKSASHYLEREVFLRNKVDVYDEAAVDFTDRLHSYFIENKS